MNSKPKSTSSNLSESSNNKASPATPRVSKSSSRLSKSDHEAGSPLFPHRLSVDRSPRSVNSKPTIERRTPKVAAPPEKQTPTRVVKVSEVQAQLSSVREDLKQANEKLLLAEKEKAQAIDDLKESRKLAEEANEKLREALVAQKRAEDDSEIEKFRAVEMEQAGIEAAQKKEEEWERELEAVRNQHALDVAALLSTTQELQKVKQELCMTSDAKSEALSHADDATKIAEIHAEKVELLSAELTRLKTLLDSKIETEADESNKTMLKLNSEIDFLRQELEKTKIFEEKLKGSEENLKSSEEELKIVEEKLKSSEEELKSFEEELKSFEEKWRTAEEKVKNSEEKLRSFEEKLGERESSIEQLTVELEAAKMAESYSKNLVEEWKKRVEDLEHRVDEANSLKRSASESLNSVMKQLEGNNDLLQDAESEISSLREKVGLLEMSVKSQKRDFDETERHLEMTKEKSSEMAKMVEFLNSELETVKEEKTKTLENEKLAAESVQTLLEEKNKLITELENLRDEEEKNKKAMESLTSALHEVSSEAREAKEKLLSSQADNKSLAAEIEDIKLVLKETNEKYETRLEDAKQEIAILMSAIEVSKHELENSRAEWEQKETNLVNCVKNSEKENSSMGKELYRISNLLEEAEKEVCASKEENNKLHQTLKEAETEIVYLKEVLGEAKGESMRFKENLMDKENELQGVVHENEELRAREATSLKRVEELTKLLEEATAKKGGEENSELTDSEKDYDMLPKVVEFSEENGNRSEEKHSEELGKENEKDENSVSIDEKVHLGTPKVENANGRPKEDEDLVEGEFKMWESCKIGDKDFSPERETEPGSFEEELDSKADESESFDQINGSSENVNKGGNSPTKQQQKKKKPLLRKFGNLLKKKGSSNQK